MVAVLAGVLCLGGCRADARPDQLTVYAAASLTDVVEELAAAYETAYPSSHVVVSVGSSSILARQIASGAPADLLLSANAAWASWVGEHAAGFESVELPITNRMIVVGGRGLPGLAAPADLLRVRRLALADPSHVPAGQYAQQALACEGLWDAVAGRVVPTLDVRAALLAVRQQAAEAALVYASDVVDRSRADVAFVWPERCQPAIQYAAARSVDGPQYEEARRFLAFIAAPERASTWTRFGFIVQPAGAVAEAGL